MKRLFVLLLWVIIIFLLGLFAYQKMTGDTPNGATTRSHLQSWRNQGTSWLRQTRSMITSTGNGSSYLTSDTHTGSIVGLSGGAVDQKKIEQDIKRNHDFLQNLQTSLEVLYPAVGKGEIYVTWISTGNHTHDGVHIKGPLGTVFYPALYNQDNAYALNQGNPQHSMTTHGIQLLDRGSGEYYVYFSSSNQVGMTMGTVLGLTRGNGQMIPNLKPLLYYKNQYLFTQYDPSGTKQGLYRAANNTLEKLGNRVITDIGIDEDLIALYDQTLNTITIHDLYTMNIIKSIVVAKSDIRFQGFVKHNQTYRIGYIDNQKQTMVYEQR